MRILFTASPLIGQLRPMLPLVRAASRAGHDVVVATGPDLVRELQRRGLQTWSVGPSAREIVAALGALRPAQGGGSAAQGGRSPAEGAADPRRTASLLFGRPGADRARQLLPWAARWRPDLVVHELTEVAGAEAAALTGAREIVFGPAGAIAAAEALLPVITAELAAALGTPDRYADLVTAPFLDSRVPALAPDAPTAFADVRTVRPELDQPQVRLPLRAARFGDRSTVLLSLGRRNTRLDTLLAALDGLRGFELNLIVETGRVDLSGLGQPPGNVALAPVVDYARALPQCVAVLGDGSAELTAAALASGRPQVVLPRTGEQLATARAVAALGAGVIVQPARLAPGAVRRALADVVADPAYARAARVQSAVIAALPSAADVLADLTTTSVAA